MSNLANAQAAWITVPSPNELPAEVASEIGEVSERIGFVPNVARLLAVTPRRFVGWWRYFDELMRGPLGLSKTQRAMIAWSSQPKPAAPTARLRTRPRCGCAPRILCWSTVSPSTTATSSFRTKTR